MTTVTHNPADPSTLEKPDPASSPSPVAGSGSAAERPALSPPASPAPSPAAATAPARTLALIPALDPVQNFLEHIDGKSRKSGAGYMVQCPAHDDRNASLSVGYGQRGDAVLKCQAGCHTEDILASVGLKWGDLFVPKARPARTPEPATPEPAAPEAAPVTTYYPYRDERGNLLYRSVRVERPGKPKDFYQEQFISSPGGAGWKRKMTGARLVPYLLPELREARQSALVFICEGEKDCDRLASVGLTASTNVGGAGKWRAEYNEHFEDRHVVVIPDNDDAGRRHARIVARNLAGVAVTVRVLELPDLPPKGDASDWLDAGNTPEQLEALAREAPPWADDPAQAEADAKARVTGDDGIIVERSALRRGVIVRPRDKQWRGKIANIDGDQIAVYYPKPDQTVWYDWRELIPINRKLYRDAPAATPARPAAAPAGPAALEGNAGEEQHAAHVATEPAEEQNPYKDRYGLHDTGNGIRIVTHYGKNLRHCHPWHKWLTWAGSHWKGDDTGEIYRRAKESAALIYHEAGRAAKAGDRDGASELADHAHASHSNAKLNAAITCAASELPMPVLPDALDRNHWLFNVANGTLDLKTGTLREHRREDLITKISPVAYDPNALCPTFDRFLFEIMRERPDLVAFVRRWIGYCLTGDVTEHKLCFFFGEGSNGKTTLLNVLLAMFGDYGWQANPELLMATANGSDRHPTEIASLFGRRFVVATETEEGRHLSEVRMKQLTGGDRLAARRMREDLWYFDPTHKLTIASNHKPVVRGEDHAVWRRIALVPFEVQAVDKPEDVNPPDAILKDPHLLDKLLEELPGILALAVRGCVEWQREGLNPPADVVAATARYRSEMDVIAPFIDDACIVQFDAIVSVTVLYEAYVGWCLRTKEAPLSNRKFTDRLDKRGFRRERRGARSLWCWVGIGLPTDPSDPVTDPSNTVRTVRTEAIPPITSRTRIGIQSYTPQGPTSDGPDGIEQGNLSSLSVFPVPCPHCARPLEDCLCPE